MDPTATENGRALRTRLQPVGPKTVTAPRICRHVLLDSESAGAGCIRQGEPAGTNKRYADRFDRQQHDHGNEMIMRGSTPASLTTPELELDRFPLTRTPVPERVKEWIHYRDAAIRTDADLVAWTQRACAVRWTLDAFHRVAQHLFESGPKPRSSRLPWAQRRARLRDQRARATRPCSLVTAKTRTSTAAG